MSLISLIRKTVNQKYSFINRHFGNRSFKLLDVGAGNHSAGKIKKLFPNCHYSGLDLDKNYSNSEEDFSVMEQFYELDLTKLDYHIIPDNHFDAIIMSHVIEHLHNGDQVLPLLLKKLKPGGLMYIEYPGIKSTKLPSMHGTLNFYDDKTHVRVYSVKELSAIYQQSGCNILSAGTRRNPYFIVGMPVRALGSLLSGKKLQGNLFWDLLGFAEFLEVRKN